MPDERIVEAHGSFASSRCTRCRTPVRTEDMRARIMRGEVVRCAERRCVQRGAGGQQGLGGLVKPDIVFFGEGLPERFFSSLADFRTADLLLVMGTSLQVQPFASLTERVRADCPRVLINMERVGELADEHPDESGGFMSRFNEGGFDFNGLTRGGRHAARDVLFQGKCDDGVLALARECGWEEELLQLRDEIWGKWAADYERLYGKKPPAAAAAAPASAAKPEEKADGHEEPKQGSATTDEAESKSKDLASDLADEIKALQVDKPSSSSSEDKPSSAKDPTPAADETSPKKKIDTNL